MKYLIQGIAVGIICMVFSSACCQGSSTKQVPEAINGVLDLLDWDFEQDGPVELNGEWKFYWKQLLTSRDLADVNSPQPDGMFSIPGVWTGYVVDGSEIPGQGYATFTLKILLKNPGVALAFRLKEVQFAYTLLANGKEIASNGRVGKTEEKMIPGALPKVVDIMPKGDQIELILQTSNFHHRNGGPWTAIQFGEANEIRNKRIRSIAMDIFLIGSLFIMGLYHLGLYLLRKKDPSTLYFGIVCLLITLRCLATGERYLTHLLPGMSWEMLFKCEYLTFYLTVPLFAMFVRALYPNEFYRWILLLIQVVTIGFSSLVVFTTGILYSYSMPIFQILTGVAGIYVIGVLILAGLRKREGALIFLAGFFFFFLTFLNDTLYANSIIHTGYFSGLGLFVFIFSQAFLLSLRFSLAFFKVESLSDQLNEKSIELSHKNEELQEWGETLEYKVQDRTSAIRDLLDNTGQGFLTFQADYSINNEYSKACSVFFDMSIGGRNALELLFDGVEDKRKDSIKETLDLVFNKQSSLDVVDGLLPGEISVNGRSLRLEYHQITPSDNKTGIKIMIVLTDISLEKQLTSLIESEEELKEIIVKVVMEKSGFLQSVGEIEEMLQDIREHLTNPVENIDLNLILRNYHTIKGVSASYALKTVAERTHGIESELMDIQSGKESLNEDYLPKLRKQTDELEELLQTTLERVNNILALDKQDENETYFQIIDSKISWLEDYMIYKLGKKNQKQIKKVIEVLCSQPLTPIFKRFAGTAVELGTNLQKGLVVELKGSQIEVPYQRFKNLFNVMIHLIRNMVDHGLEKPDMRERQKKPKNGKLSIEASKINNHLKIIVGDDGSGMNIENIKKTAIEKEIVTRDKIDILSKEDLLRLIFEPGFSTKKSATGISGRGIGMNAVKDAVDKLGGSINIKTEPNRGTSFEILIPPS